MARGEGVTRSFTAGLSAWRVPKEAVRARPIDSALLNLSRAFGPSQLYNFGGTA
ncbi:MAG TPA: hypothetical protein VKV29_15110 [Chthonomonas sp.]|uniref:hypothetical protein n=1 Tax=Chthonomonas sp. TaxID=2282153 RepID=UPI002B4AE5AE|nr:hypothetical protein [Chthonomonas sp.]HLH81599.1 hypothetical protein [Chthonomonas sp.]